MRIVFWDIMPYDFDTNMTPEKSYSILSYRSRPGSVIVLHDKPGSHALVYLDRFIRSSLEKGYTFGSLDDYSLHR
jgi:peptidoglycan/xylan/chitin deacetylase (PgdA/CDA1 family)